MGSLHLALASDGSGADGLASVIDAVESWIVRQSYWVQVPLLLVVLLPLAWLVAGLIDRVVERILRPHSRREALLSGVHPAGRAPGQTDESDDG